MLCSLCELRLPKNPIVDGERSFCCAGCRTVFHLLATQEAFGGEALAEIRSAPVSPSPKEVRKIHFEITGMWCSTCAEAISVILRRHGAVASCLVDYATDLAIVTYDPMQISKDDIFKKIARLGYEPKELLEEEKTKAQNPWIRFATAAFCTLNIMMFSLPFYLRSSGEGFEKPLGWLCFSLALPLITYCLFPLMRRFVTSCKSGIFGMETLVLISVGAAFGISVASLVHGSSSHLYFDSMSMLISLVLIGKILEGHAKFSAKETLFRLTRTLPKKGRRRLPDGSIEAVPLKEITQGDVLVATMGEKVALDGVVRTGVGLCNEAVMTGESLSVQKRPGSSVVGGSVVVRGGFDFEVTGTFDHSLLGQILDAIERQLGSKRSERRLLMGFLPYFVPAVVALAAATAFLSGDIARALSVLLIACPCAIGIAEPLAESLLIRRFAARGALVRNRKALALLAKHPRYVFDKTGTLTEGEFRVREGLEELMDGQKRTIKALALASTHPLCVALAESIEGSPLTLDHVEEVVGLGMVGVREGKTYLLGSKKLVTNAPDCQGGETPVFFSEEGQVLATLLLEDRLRAVSLPEGSLLLSGDHEAAVARVARACGIETWQSGCSPFDKQREIEKLKRQGVVVMVGDGVNDAAALSAADVGISVSSGTEMAIAVSDLLLTTRDVSSLGPLAKRGQRIIAQNLFWAFFYNVIGIGFALCGALHPLVAVFAMALSSTAVTVNSLRVRL